MTRPTLLIATWNRGKVEEIRSMLGELQVSLLALQEIPGMGTFPEAGSTYEENAVGKAIHYSRMVPYLTVADDSGLEVEALDGKPGIFSARFAGEGATSVEKCRELLSLLKEVPEEGRGAAFQCVVALARRGKLIRTFQGSCRGRIASRIAGPGRFGFDPVFHYPPAGITFAELGAGEKNRVSHRGRAVSGLLGFLSGEGKSFLEFRES